MPSLLDHSILLIKQSGCTQRENSTGGAVIIDAMDLLYGGRFFTFCLVSRESDLTGLAVHHLGFN